VVMEKPLDDPPVNGACYDIMMLALSGGKERSFEAYDMLFARSDFRRVKNYHQQVRGRSTFIYQKND
jgi:hypothetical protein